MTPLNPAAAVCVNRLGHCGTGARRACAGQTTLPQDCVVAASPGTRSEMLGTDLGDRLTGDRAMGLRRGGKVVGRRVESCIVRTALALRGSGRPGISQGFARLPGQPHVFFVVVPLEAAPTRRVAFIPSAAWPATGHQML